MTFDGKLSALTKRLRRASDPIYELTVFKDRCKPDEILKYAHRLPEILGPNAFLYGWHRVERIDDLTRTVSRWLLSADKTVLWAGAEIRINAKLIVDFVALADRFEWQVLSRNYLEAKKTLCNPLTIRTTQR